MLTKISSRLTDLLIKKSKTVSYDKEVYIYGLELVLSTVFCFVGILLSSCLLSNIYTGIIFILILAPLRTFTGGYHADSYAKCFLISNVLYAVLLIINNYVLNNMNIIIWWTLLLIFSLYISKRAPIINKAQPIKREKQEICKRNTRYVLVFDAIFIFSLFFLNRELMNMAILCIGLVAVLMLIAEKPIYKKEVF